MIKNAVTILLQILLIVFLGFVAREAWTAYQQEKLTLLFDKESKLISVHVDKVSHEKKTWKDYIGNSKYLEFSFKGKQYDVRHVQTGPWVGEGDLIQLQYNPGLDIFRQPGILYHKAPNVKQSKLIKWTVVSLFSFANRWLFAFFCLVIIITLFVLSILANVTKIGLFSTLSGWLIAACFIAGAIFNSWDTWENYQYYQRLKNGAESLQLTLLDKSRQSLSHENSANDFRIFYFYTAAVNFNQEDRAIMISADEFENLSTKQSFKVLYNRSMDDMMSAGYSLGYWRLIFAILLWIIVVFILAKKW